MGIPSEVPDDFDGKVDFIFKRYDKDRDGIWKYTEANQFMLEIRAKGFDQVEYSAWCKELNCESPDLDTLKNRYKDKPDELENDFGMCLGLSACIA
eukprot:TRINITY_DN3373_c1_g1_i4.p2 TRINITY_DN3373_c1_g1~~TRINITY_DN3373_c1_g1_i4.p2  ORF type:complete len:111 (+),score=28.28 TRINITY_DN3373_c1_g1_i4:47-334(+)